MKEVCTFRTIALYIFVTRQLLFEAVKLLTGQSPNQNNFWIMLAKRGNAVE